MNSPMAVMVHPPYGTIELLLCTGDDLGVVNAAKVSFGKESTWKMHPGLEPDDPPIEMLSQPDAYVLGYLMRNKHGTPFEHNLLTFRVKAPIFVFREWHRHRIGVSINEMSGRYTRLRKEFYIPDGDHVREQVGKPGAYNFVTASKELTEATQRELEETYEIAWGSYIRMINNGVAKELARLCLPVATYSEMYWSCNARSLMAFLALRNKPDAQREIKDYAAVMEQMFLEKMPVTAQAFIDNGRVAP